MDNFTHGLFGLTIGALRKPDGAPGPASPTDKAVLLASVLASELPDLDSLWPASDEVMNALQAHRGFSHSLVAAPVLALAATLAAKLFFRGARTGVVYIYSLAAVIFAHLIPDLWTGWGTRVLLPFSYERFSWDLTMVVDPLVTLPLLAGAIWAWRRRERWRQALLAGLAVAAVYLLVRGAAYGVLQSRVAGAHSEARQVQVFPTWMGLNTWRYVAVYPTEYVTGEVTLLGQPKEQKLQPVPAADLLPPDVQAVPTVREALAWARFPLVSQVKTVEGGAEIRIADLRYHLRGEPTLTFVVELGSDLTVRAARLDRGGTAGELLKRWRKD